MNTCLPEDGAADRHGATPPMSNIYQDGTYLENNSEWHVADAPWKAEQIRAMLSRNGLNPETICEVGCGAGQILRILSERMTGVGHFYGYEISPRRSNFAVRLGGH